MTPSSHCEIYFSESYIHNYIFVNRLDDKEAKTTTVLTALVTCYNEQEYIIATLNDLSTALDQAELSYEIIIIDDCSSDNSASLIKEYVANHPKQNLIFRKNLYNIGLDRNFKEGAYIGSGEFYKLFCGDNSESQSATNTVCSLLGTADIIIPYYIKVDGKTKFRLWQSNLYTLLVNILSGHKLKYYNGLPIFRRKHVRQWHSTNVGFGFQADIICMLLNQGLSYKEVGVNAQCLKSNSRTWSNYVGIIITFVNIIIRRISKASNEIKNGFFHIFKTGKIIK